MLIIFIKTLYQALHQLIFFGEFIRKRVSKKNSIPDRRIELIKKRLSVKEIFFTYYFTSSPKKIN